jgi:WD40 repeat protein/class 3 adenylate cyclase/energy-coupling factor transporter ATP-binding protein EcfA2
MASDLHPAAKGTAANALPPSGTVTFLFTDIEGSTRLLEQLRGRYAELLSDHRRILREAFTTWHGHEIDTQGDSFFVAFTRAADALRCAIDCQRALSGWQWPEGVAVSVRMGVHTGEPMVASVGYVGIDVHRAARIAAAGHGGQILLSGTTRDLVADDLPDDIELVDLGSHRLKDMRTVTRLHQVAGADLRSGFAPLVTQPAEEPAAAAGEAPYRGLQAFEEQDAALFFGREEIVEQLAAQVRDARFVALIGASGSGKSSILRAGLLPEIRATIPGALVRLLTPTAHPLEAIAAAIAPDASPADVAALADQLRRDPRSLAIFLRRTRDAIPVRKRAGHTSPTVIAVDQLEEVFTLCRDETERLAFLDGLVYACGLNDGSADSPSDGDRATIVVTLRADFYAFLAPYPRLRDAAAESQKYVGAMSTTELRRAIEEPARRGGWEFTPGLVDLLLRDVGDEPGALPLLSHALLETWRRRRGTTMTLRSYAESGEVKGAIARTADRVYGSELSEPQGRIARNIFVRLTELGEGTQDTRRRARLSELLPDDAKKASAVRSVIVALADARLITVGEETVEVAHEALIREWPTLREWLTADREGLRLHRRLTDAATEWELSAFDESLLFRGARLGQARESTVYTGVLSELERRFLDASVELAEREQVEREAAERRALEQAQALAAEQSRRAAEAARSADRLRRRALLLTGALALAGVLAGVAVVLAGQSDANAELAAQRADEAQQRANEARANATLAAEAAQDARENETLAQTQAREALAQRLAADATQIVSSGRDPELAALLALAGLEAGYTRQGDAAMQRAGRQISGRGFEHDAELTGIAITPDGRTMFTAARGIVHVWDVESATELNQLTIPRIGDLDGYWQIELSDDGTSLIASDYFGPAGLWRLDPAHPETAQASGVGCEALGPGIHAMSADGRVIASADDVEIRAWRMPECEQIGDAIAAVDLNDPALSPDGSLLTASVFGSSILRVWDLATGSMVSDVQRFEGTFWHPSFSSDGTTIAVGLFDGTAQTFGVVSGELLQTFRGHADSVERAVLTRDGSKLLTSSRDGTARLWNSLDGRELRRLVHSDAVAQSAVTANGLAVFTASSDGTARRWSAGEEEFNFLAELDREVTSLSFSANGERLASAAGDSFRVFDLTAESEILHLPAPGARLVAFSPIGSTILTVSNFQTAILDSTDGLSVPLDSSDRGEILASAAASFSGDGEIVIAPLPGTPDAVIVHNAMTGARVTGLDVQTAVLSRDGKYVAAWNPGRYSVYDLTTNGVVANFGLGQTNGRRVDLQFTPDGSRIVSGDHDNVIRVRDIATRQIALEMGGHGAPVRQVRVSANGRYVLSAGDDGGANLWSLESGELVRSFAGHEGLSVTSIAISSDGGLVALGSTDGSVIVTPGSLDQLVEFVCMRLGRDLTEEERLLYRIESNEPTCP